MRYTKLRRIRYASELSISSLNPFDDLHSPLPLGPSVQHGVDFTEATASNTRAWKRKSFTWPNCGAVKNCIIMENYSGKQSKLWKLITCKYKHILPIVKDPSIPAITWDSTAWRSQWIKSIQLDLWSVLHLWGSPASLYWLRWPERHLFDRRNTTLMFSLPIRATGLFFPHKVDYSPVSGSPERSSQAHQEEGQSGRGEIGGEGIPESAISTINPVTKPELYSTKRTSKTNNLTLIISAGFFIFLRGLLGLLTPFTWNIWNWKKELCKTKPYREISPLSPLLFLFLGTLPFRLGIELATRWRGQSLPKLGQAVAQGRRL